MHNNPVIMQLVSDPSVNDEYSQKISELDRRLKMNNLSYEHWDTLNDRQRETFVLDLFMDGDSASSIENYVENAYHNCDCPDVVDDLEQDSPALMARIQNAKAYVAGQPAPARPVQFESLLNEMIDNLLTEKVAMEPSDPSTLQVGTDPLPGGDVKLMPEQRYERAQKAALKHLQEANPKVSIYKDGKGYYDPKTGKSKQWVYTNTLGPQSARYELLQKIANDPAFKGADIQFTTLNHKGFNAEWQDGLVYSIRIKRGGAKGIGNKGDILEGILAAAFYLRFKDPEDTDIDAAEVKNILFELDDETPAAKENERIRKGALETKVERTTEDGKDATDTYRLEIGLAKGVFNDMVARGTEEEGEADKPRGWLFAGELKPLVLASEKAVDIPEVKALAKAIAENDKVDKVEIKAIGTEGQTVTKADLNIVLNGSSHRLDVDDKEDPTNKILNRIGNLSVKYNSTLLGQTGKGWNTYKTKKGKEHIGIRNSILDIFGVDVGDREDEWSKFLLKNAGKKKTKRKKGGGDLIKGYLGKFVVNPVYKELSKILNKKEDKKALDELMDKLAEGVRYAATKGDEAIGFLSVGEDKKNKEMTARYLDWYSKFTDTMKGANAVNLEITKTMGKGNNPMLLFYDADHLVDGKLSVPKSKEAENVMFSWRGKQESEGKTVRTYIEFGKRLANLIAIEDKEALEKINDKIKDATEKSDKNVQEESNKKPGSLLEFDSPRKIPSNVQAYEQKVLDSMKANGILGKMEDADSDANGPDAEMVIGGKTHYIEVKLNMNAQMGDKTIKYFPSSGEFQASDKFDDDTKAAIENGMKQIEDDVVNFINFIEDDRYEQSSKWRKQKGADPLGSFATTLKKWRGAIENKLYNKITTGFGKDIEDPVTGDTIPRLRLTMKDDFISQMYASKKLPTYYIQVGGLGLYRLGAANPANLPVPVFKGVISLETRPKPSGGEKELDTEKKKITVNTKKDGSGEDISFLPMYAPERDKDGNIQYRYDKKGNLKMKKIASGKTGRKGEEIPDYEPARAARDEGKGEFFKVTGAYMGTARFRSPTGDPKDIKKSPYTLDDPESIAAMLKAMGQAPEDTESEDS